jgi:hypothetical protein
MRLIGGIIEVFLVYWFHMLWGAAVVFAFAYLFFTFVVALFTSGATP